jgi:phosphoglycolate phosphatase
VAVTYGAHPADVLDSLMPLYSAKSVPDLHDWLTQHA